MSDAKKTDRQSLPVPEWLSRFEARSTAAGYVTERELGDDGRWALHVRERRAGAGSMSATFWSETEFALDTLTRNTTPSKATLAASWSGEMLDAIAPELVAYYAEGGS